MKSWFKFLKSIAVVGGIALAFGACDETLDTGLACPALCPHQQATIQDTTFFAVELDTSVAGFPTLGSEPTLVIASMGDTLETMAIVRYDSLPTTFRYSVAAEDSLIYAVDSVDLKIFFTTGDTLGAPTTLELYDVDLGGAEDSDPSAVRTAFTPDRLLATRTIPADSMRDTVSIPIPATRLLAKILAPSPGNRLRIGIKINASGGGANQLSMLSSNNIGAEPVLRFRPHTDPAVAKYTVEPLSTTPENPFIRAGMRDYLLVATAPPDPPADVIRVGGLPGRRAYIRFDIPSSILDSSNVVRATLLLTQRPNPGAPESTDSLVVQEFQVLAAPAITDLTRALLFVSRFRSQDTVSLAAAESDVVSFEIIELVRTWRGTTAEKTPRAMALASPSEGSSPRLVDFYSIEAPEALRPRLRISYLPQAGGGLP
ncbi:MAG TPA: hypothetical protein VEB19_02800 [Gemmatimonadaceae bacterium]|nr:hypothetical protein [Gemmatimonadaceae bacterium]